MIKYITKSTIELRVETEEDADALHKQMAKEAEDMGAVLTAWTQTLKTRKQQGEIVEEYYHCKATTAFGDIKEPTFPLKKIEYDIAAGGFVSDDDDVPFDGGNTVSAF